MIALFKNLAKDSVVYGLSAMITRFASFFLVPIYTKILDPSEYGKFSLINATFYLLAVFAVFALDAASARWYYDTKDELEQKKVIATWVWFQLVTTLCIILLSTICAPIISTALFNKVDYTRAIKIAALSLLSNLLPTVAMNWLRYRHKAKYVLIMSVSTMLLTIGLNILFVVKLKSGFEGILISTVIVQSITTMLILGMMKGWLSYKYFCMKKLKEMLNYALPLIPTAFAFWILNSSSSYVLNYYYGEAEVGLFQVGSTVASIVTMVVGAFQMAWGPFAFSIMEKPEAKQVFAAVFIIYAALMSTLALSVGLFAPEILQVFTSKQYFTVAFVSSILAFNNIIYGFAYIAVLGCNVMKDNKPLATSVLFAAIITAICYRILVPTFGKEGAALSMVLGYLIVPVYLFIKSQKYWYIPFDFKIGLAILMVSVMCAFIAKEFNVSPQLSAIAIIKKFGLLFLNIIFIYIVSRNYLLNLRNLVLLKR